MRSVQFIGLTALRDRARRFLQSSPAPLNVDVVVAGYVTQAIALAGLTPEELRQVAKQAAVMAEAMERNRVMPAESGEARVAGVHRFTLKRC
jgi:hypothetical protein